MKANKLQNYFLISISFIYLWAFSSLYVQVPGLYGDNGITPARSLLKCDSDNVTECVFAGSRPTLMHLASRLNLTPMQGLDVLCLVGITLSSLSIIFIQFRNTLVYFSLWYCYFSCFQVGQTFLWFQWDTLLLETGFLTVFVAPFNLFRGKYTQWMPQDNVALFLVRWLAFRLMFASGIVKLTSECPTWWGLTALNYHYETQCIPTPMSWYAQQLPEWFQKLSVVATYVIEIFIPPLFFAPVHHLRVFAAASQTFFMLLIIITGNYNFFNILTVVLCCTMLIDSEGSHINTKTLQKRLPKIYFIVKWIFVGFIYSLVVYCAIKLFNLRIVGLTVQSEIIFTKHEFYAALSWIMPKVIIVGSICFAIEIITALVRCVVDFVQISTVTMIRVTVQCAFVCSICVVLFCISLVPLSYLDRGSHDNLWPIVKELHATYDQYQLTHSYGLFRHMTGVGGRPEVIIEGAMTLDGPWKEYEFLYKPGSVNRRPPFVVPHQPRLDWQMWFAALGSYQHNPWFISLVYKLLTNEPQVLKLIDKNPFPKKPPKYIRAHLYHYHFTSWFKDDKNYNAENWWTRTVQSEYLPATSLDHTALVNYLKQNGFLIEKPMYPAKSAVTTALRSLRQLANNFAAPQFVWMLTVTVSLISVCHNKFFNK